jgi:transposase-like protein
MGRIRPAYPREFREEAVRLVRESGKSIGHAKDLGVADQSLRN